MPFAVCVQFRLLPGREEEFLSHIRENARASVANEPGCQRFDVCTDPERPGEVFLYELYDDLAAFETHQTMPHYAACGAAIGGMVAEKTLTTWSRAAE